MWNFSNKNEKNKSFYELLSDTHLVLAFEWFIIGTVATLFSLTGNFSSVLKWLIFFPTSFFLYHVATFFKQHGTNPNQVKLLMTMQTIIAIVYLTGLLVPEVAFDAVWYHLPVIKEVAQYHGLVYIKPIYQSLNPLFSDLIYGLGFMVAKEWGSKVVAFLLYLSTVCLTYTLSRLVMNKHWSLFSMLLVSTFQVVAWQSSSFYVDLPKAYWEIACLLALIDFYTSTQKKTILLVLSACFFGASLGTKLFSLFLLPIFWILIFFSAKTPKKVLKDAVLFSLVSLLIPLPFYLFAYYHTGNPFYSFALHLDKLSEIGGNSHALSYVIHRTVQLPLSIFQLFFARDYTSPLLILTIPLLVKFKAQIWKNKTHRMLLLFSAYQFLIWWYVPPLSTRYALSGFITWSLLSVWSIQAYVKKNPHFKKPMQLALLLLILVQVSPRLIVATKNLQYFFSDQSREEFIRSKFDGTIDQHLKQWYEL